MIDLKQHSTDLIYKIVAIVLIEIDLNLWRMSVYVIQCKIRYRKENEDKFFAKGEIFSLNFFLNRHFEPVFRIRNDSPVCQMTKRLDI